MKYLASVAIRRAAVLMLLLLIATLMQGINRTRTVWASERPNIILMMADDQGWGETGYYQHPVLKTPNLDAMAANGLRLDRFYAAAPVCSPTRASVLTGRSNHRSGVDSHGYPLRLQEKTIAQALQAAGYQTGHFGKWHLNGLRGPGVPVLESDDHHPGVFGFDTWLSVTNFFDRDPILSRGGKFEEYQGDSSEIVVEQALEFVRQEAQRSMPFFAVIWFGTPHSPFRAAEEDMRGFAELDESSKHHYGELVALDRSVGTLRNGLRELGIERDTIFWYCSDNGGLPKIHPSTVGGLRGFKGSLYEGGLRVPAIVEWPEQIPNGLVSDYPSSTMDIFPTLVEVLDLPPESMLQPQDGSSLLKLFQSEAPAIREKPIPFHCFGETAIIDNDYKLLLVGRNKKRDQQYELYHLKDDPEEARNLVLERPEIARSMKEYLHTWLQEVQASEQGLDYPERRVNAGEPKPKFWREVPEYRPYFESWRKRPEYASQLKNLSP
ncbi:MAG: sulfatase-like hydrolase/transferase [bacterium]|nr:sulfatase-like hydrolase/transferase [bacterium]